MRREVAESCVDAMLMEMVSVFCHQFYSAEPELAARRIEAIGYQVGHQLVERFICGAHKSLKYCKKMESHLVGLFCLGKPYRSPLFSWQDLLLLRQGLLLPFT
ncbi:hypothetical protein HPP92_027517 [Vanilla planifolia]|uniref:Uncharacterized protein n=1 Tax=Vanilla planifolia TaxID=51239 RepID=A0A835U4A2_VANPL|nr:hypothetical protein HPP92_027517 [Vanilla planifolia]